MGLDLKSRLEQAAAEGSQPAPELDNVFGCKAPVAAGYIKRRETKPLPINLLDPWSDKDNARQPFRLYDQKKKQEMMKSMSTHGLLFPILVRPVGNRYQILAGHNRVDCAKALYWQEIDTIILYGLSDAEAAQIMVETNFAQRDYIAPSERARGYKILMDNMSHQGQAGGRSDVIIGEQEGVGRSTIQRYLSLNRLTDAMLDIVDGYQYDPDAPDTWTLIHQKPAIPLTAAEKLVNLSEHDQNYIVSLFMERKIKAVTPPQATDLKNAIDNTTANDLPQHLIDRCLGVVKSDRNQGPRLFSFKLSTDFFRVSKTDTKKYMQDPELQQLVAQTIEAYIAARRGG